MCGCVLGYAPACSFVFGMLMSGWRVRKRRRRSTAQPVTSDAVPCVLRLNLWKRVSAWQSESRNTAAAYLTGNRNSAIARAYRHCCPLHLALSARYLSVALTLSPSFKLSLLAAGMQIHTHLQCTIVYETRRQMAARRTSAGCGGNY